MKKTKGLLIMMILGLILGVGWIINQEETSGNISKWMNGPDILGEVLEVSEDGLSILVDSNTKDVQGQIWISINEETNFLSNVSREFKVGNKVSMVSTGQIAESYPMQGGVVAVYSNEEN